MIDDIPGQACHGNRDKDTGVHSCSKKGVKTQLGRNFYRLRVIPSIWIAKAAKQHGRDQVGRNIVHKDCRQDLVHCKLLLQKNTDACIQSPADHTNQQHQRDSDNTGQICQHCASGNSGSESGNRHLAFSACVGQANTGRNACRKTRQDQIRRTDNYFAKAVSRTKNRCNDGLIRHKRRFALRQEQPGKRDQRKQDADQDPNCQAVLKLQRLLLCLIHVRSLLEA